MRVRSLLPHMDEALSCGSVLAMALGMASDQSISSLVGIDLLALIASKIYPKL